MNFFDPAGQMIECYTMESLANEQRISLRAGCHCNPGAREAALGFTRQDLEVCFRDKEQINFDQFLERIDGKTTGALRVSIGLATNFADAYRFVRFAQRFVDRYDIH
jgi:selenocysteine lyase/cysteine desulfurase